MLALGIRYLTGYAVATDVASRQHAEWPPHPGRVFMALAAAHFESPADAEPNGEREALEWLQALGPPAIQASEAGERTAVKHFVPVNDKAGPAKATLQSAPSLTRHRAERTFPRARPNDDQIYLIWQDAEPNGHGEALRGLCAKVARIGHSSSLVQMWLTEGDIAPKLTWMPQDDFSERRLRISSQGLLGRLEDLYGASEREAHAVISETIAELEQQKKAVKGSGARERKQDIARQIEGLNEQRAALPPRDPIRPTLGLWQGYTRVQGSEPAIAGSVFDPRLLVLRLRTKASEFRRLDVASTQQVTARIREAVIAKSEQLGLIPIPEVIHGHDDNGRPADRPHLAFITLPVVGHTHADGHLMGVAVALPRSDEKAWPTFRDERRDVLRAVAQVTELKLGRLGVWTLDPVTDEMPPVALRSVTWVGPRGGYQVWGTVTPIAFDRHPKTKDKAAYLEQVSNMVRQACLSVGLPQPTHVRITPISAHLGAPTARTFPRLKRKRDGGDFRQAHAVLWFDQPVRGPVLIGAGRFRGYGLCRPIFKKEFDDA